MQKSKPLRTLKKSRVIGWNGESEFKKKKIKSLT